MHAAMGLGFGFSNLPSVKRAKQSAQNVFAIIDEESTLDVREGKKQKLQEVEAGEIELKDVTFKYPARPDVKVLDQLNLKIEKSQKIALVGASGCGKSTITSLLLRFYNQQEGQILIDGHPINDYNIKKLRHQIGYVMQEPILFNQTIEENIKYGKQDATNFEVRRACEQANALQFIESNIEDLDKAKYEEKIKNEVNAKISDRAYESLRQHLAQQDFPVWELLWNVFTKADDKALKAIRGNVAQFVETVKESERRKGVKWDNLCFNTEWWIEVKQ